MIVVGLTGTPGAGKSTVAGLFEGWGAVRIDTDRLSREVTRPGSPALEEIRATFGEAVLEAEGGLDRAALRRRVFADDEARERLEAILHPAILDRVDRRVARAREAGAEVVVVEVPLLFEKGLRERFDVVVAVDAPVERRRRRVHAARGLSAAEFAAVDAAQWSGERKREAADLVVVNDGDRDTLRERARRTWERLPSAAAGRP